MGKRVRCSLQLGQPFRFPFSVFRFPFSVFRFPFSVFRFPFSVFRFPFSVFCGLGMPVLAVISLDQSVCCR